MIYLMTIVGTLIGALLGTGILHLIIYIRRRKKLGSKYKEFYK